MAPSPLIIHLAGEEDTDRLAQCLAPLLHGGDTILLEGAIGAGKTHFCRALIRARLEGGPSGLIAFDFEVCDRFRYT